MARVDLGQAFINKDTGAFTCAVQHGGGFGVVVQARIAPVVHDHRQIHVIGGDAHARACHIVGRAQAVLDVTAGVNGAGHGVRQSDGRSTRRPSQAFL